MSTRFQVRTEVRHGLGALGHLSTIEPGPVLLVTDAYMASTELCHRVVELLGAQRTTLFTEVEPNPSVQVVTACTRVLVDCAPCAVVALGGGSSIDTAKATLKVARESGIEVARGLIVVPTTSGSGSEATSFAVITDTSSHHKLTLIADDMLPEVAVLDPVAVATAPPRITADTGLDVLTHAVEAYVSTGHSDFTDAMAEKAVQLTCANLARCFTHGNDLLARERMHNASALAGMAFQNSGLGITHSLSHAIGGMFPVAHGRLNGMLLPHVLRHNAGLVGRTDDTCRTTMERLAWLGHLVGGAGEQPRLLAQQLVAAIVELADALQVPRRITGEGVDPVAFRRAIPELAATALCDACTATNPRQTSGDQLQAILVKLVD